MQIKHLKLNNFCGFFGSKTFDHDFFEKTEITGANEAGKSTVKKSSGFLIAETRMEKKFPAFARMMKMEMTSMILKCLQSLLLKWMEQ